MSTANSCQNRSEHADLQPNHRSQLLQPPQPTGKTLPAYQRSGTRSSRTSAGCGNPVVRPQTGLLTEPQRRGELQQSGARHWSCQLPACFVLFVPFVVHPQRHQRCQIGMRYRCHPKEPVSLRLRVSVRTNWSDPSPARERRWLAALRTRRCAPLTLRQVFSQSHRDAERCCSPVPPTVTKWHNTASRR